MAYGIPSSRFEDFLILMEFQGILMQACKIRNAMIELRMTEKVRGQTGLHK